MPDVKRCLVASTLVASVAAPTVAEAQGADAGEATSSVGEPSDDVVGVPPFVACYGAGLLLVAIGMLALRQRSRRQFEERARAAESREPGRDDPK